MSGISGVEQQLGEAGVAIYLEMKPVIEAASVARMSEATSGSSLFWFPHIAALMRATASTSGLSKIGIAVTVHLIRRKLTGGLPVRTASARACPV